MPSNTKQLHFIKNLNPCSIIFLVLICFTFPLFAQSKIQYTSHFTQKLKQCQLRYHKTNDAWLRIVQPHKDDLVQADLILTNDDENYEEWYILHETSSLDQSFYPHVALPSLITTFSSNIEDHDITFISLSKKELDELHADWGVWSHFKSKKSLTHLAHCSALSLYNKSKGWCVVFYLFDDPDFIPIPTLAFDTNDAQE